MVVSKALSELHYHEQQEGWTHEQLQDRECMCLVRPRDLGGGFATIDYERRIYGCGYGKPRQHAGTRTYEGRGWQDRILRDAIEHLETIMTASNLA